MYLFYFFGGSLFRRQKIPTEYSALPLLDRPRPLSCRAKIHWGNTLSFDSCFALVLPDNLKTVSVFQVKHIYIKKEVLLLFLSRIFLLMWVPYISFMAFLILRFKTLKKKEREKKEDCFRYEFLKRDLFLHTIFHKKITPHVRPLGSKTQQRQQTVTVLFFWVGSMC